MSAIVGPRPMTVAEFLAWEERQPIRYEFNGFRPVPRAEASLAHAIIGGNLAAVLHGLLRGTPCRAFGSDAKVVVAGRVRYPDLSVSCARQLDPVLSRQGVVPEPVVVCEVLSEITATLDYIEKNLDYAATPSIQRYIMLEQDRLAATVYQRDGADWFGRPLIGAETMLGLPEVGIGAIRLGDLYEGVAFDPVASAASAPP